MNTHKISMNVGDVEFDYWWINYHYEDQPGDWTMSKFSGWTIVAVID